MAIVNSNDNTFPHDDYCDECGEELDETFIFWQGVHKQYCLHPRCARYIGIQLMKDFVECSSHKEEGIKDETAVSTSATDKEY